MLWDRPTGEPVHNAVVWISKQTDDIVKRWSRGRAGRACSGSAPGCSTTPSSPRRSSPGCWRTCPTCAARAEAGELAFGTVDTWLLWNLTGGRSHLTDHSAASRTALFNLEALTWDAELCQACGIPMAIFRRPSPPTPTSASSARTWRCPVAEVPVRAVLADQQAGLFGQACFEPGAAKNTFGTAGVLTVNCRRRSPSWSTV